MDNKIHLQRTFTGRTPKRTLLEISKELRGSYWVSMVQHPSLEFVAVVAGV
ncbi:hypothetical protein [Ammoniphilus sp. YIM 78166]|uniref:hypothetical protein n=1 Tax=Ammoniphilus sp. YIM 78166 TaxID=1644106 RepID=UPI001431D549|nr:hypothetical protein [Ammoniphilus sp. YIM 78166]